MSKYSVQWKDLEGNTHEDFFQAYSLTGAIAKAIESIDYLQSSPHLIHRVLLEDAPNQR